ncbi:CSS-motif domain-containing protein [Pseudomonas sp. GD03860]|uniref:CSS-motif domain-containing protein n=1 Tax=Pseudomonas TaxID=286 RepID=UPI002363E211|nr:MULTISPECIES: CSS-motif domain-containing protein [Pseudomonas]MDD2058022.1 CSS-motif domain-containing protein [Pseudomonas putida]MDH0639479.1 CSS-motif domain-containing protein [Pseudomonas sp. GD03860]
MVPHSYAGRSLVEFLITLLIGLAPVACGLLVLSLQVERKQEETIEVTAREAIYTIDHVMSSLHTTSSQALVLAQKPCDAALPELRQIAIRQPNVRSLMLVKENLAYCSTLFGDFQRIIDPGSFLNMRLRVDPSSEATPHSGVLIYRLQEFPFGVLALANLQVLQRELLGFQNEVVLILQFGPQYVWATGNGAFEQTPDHEEDTLQVVSKQYGYTVHAGYPDSYTWGAIQQAITATLPSLLLVGILTSAVAYWAMFRRKTAPAPRPH